MKKQIKKLRKLLRESEKFTQVKKNQKSLEDQAKKRIKIGLILNAFGEENDDLDNSVESYQELLKLNNLIEKKFQKNFRSIRENTNKKIKDIIKRK